VNSALGQGDVLVSPIQLANAYATFANGGTLHAPNLVWRVLQPTEDGLVTVRELTPRVVRQVDLADSTRIPIEAGLRGVVSDPSGTAYRAFEGFDATAFPIAAKTGTAEVRGKEDNAVFAAYGPIGAPRYSMSVVVEEGGFGSVGAGPIARYLFDRLSGQVALQPARSLRPVIVLDVPTTPPAATNSSPTTTAPPTSAPTSSPSSTAPGGAP
jgi:penicillin-binding protein 2